MPFFKTSFISRITLFVAAALLSFSTMAADFNQTQRLANQGDAEAQTNLGVMYDNGKGVRQDDTKAVEWYTKAANQGDASAQTNLGFMYYGGKGVRQSTPAAKKWFGKACDNGYQEGCDNYRILNNR